MKIIKVTAISVLLAILLLRLFAGGSRDAGWDGVPKAYLMENAAPPGHGVVFGEPDVYVGEVVMAATHHGRIEKGGIEWDSELLLAVHEKYEGGPLEFAQPLPAGSLLVTSKPFGAKLLSNADGLPVGVQPPAASAEEREFSVTIHQPFEGMPAMQPPILGEFVAQRLTLDGAYLDLAASTPLSHYVWYRATDDISHAQIRWFEGRFGLPPAHDGTPIYFRGSPLFFDEGGLSGSIAPATQSRFLWLMGLLAAVLVLRAAGKVRSRSQTVCWSRAGRA